MQLAKEIPVLLTALAIMPCVPTIRGQENAELTGNLTDQSGAVIPNAKITTLSLFDTFPLTAGKGPRLELRFESFNTFNHTEFQSINTGFADGNFGQVMSTYDLRAMQFGGKFIF